MARLEYPSLASALLDGGIDDDDTDITLKSETANWPAAGDFWVKIDDEIIGFTGTPSSSTWSGCLRGEDDTTAASHSDDAEVKLILGEAALDLASATQNQAGPFASLPANGAGRAGQFYYCTDTDLVYLHNGTSWQPYPPGSMRGGPLTLPANSGYSWDNQGDATVTTNYGGLYFTFPGQVSFTRRLYVKSAPATPWTINAIVNFAAIHNTGNESNLGLVMRESGTGKWYVHGPAFETGSRQVQTLNATNNTFNALVYSGVAHSETYPHIWLRMSDNGTNIKGEYSVDGRDYITAFDVARGTFFSTGPDQIGFGGYVQTNAGYRYYLHCIHYVES